jgi:hypothetical protein
MSDELAALQSIDFEWTTHIDSIWRDLPHDVPGLQETLRSEALMMLERLFASSSRASPLGMVVMGPGGSGKTHLLSLLRGGVLSRGAFFVLVDMTDVREFWDITLLGYIRSLTQGQPSQQERLMRGLVQLADGTTTFEKLRSGRPPKLINVCSALIAGLRQKFPEFHEHQDVLRALVLLGSDDNDILDLGWKWLQGIGIDEGEKLLHGFHKSIGTPRDIVRGLSYLMSLVGPTLLALDQLDAIVAELQLVSAAAPSGASDEIDPRHAGALAIIQGIAKGLIALRDTTSRTQTLVACLEQTWHALDKRALVTMADRFQPPLLLKPVTSAQHVQQLVEQRITPAYREHAFVPPYPSYPFRPGFFATLRGLSPRAVLKRCDEHRWLCLRRGQVVEIDVDLPEGPGGMVEDFDDARREFQVLAKQADVERMLLEEDEDALDKLLETACRALVAENPVPDDIDVPVDLDFVGAGAYVPLHARVRVVYRSEAEREKHYATRFMQKSNPIAFQARLKAAMTASGIDQSLGFRRLALFRCGPVPGGPTTARLLSELHTRGGKLIEPSLDELRTLWALGQMLALGSTTVLVRDWLQTERIVSRLPSFADAARYLFGDAAQRSIAPPRPSAHGGTRHHSSQPARVGGSVSLQPEPEPGAFDDQLFVGSKLVAGKPKGPVELPLANLAKHTVVLAGAGSGKTVLVRRIVEEAALLGVPSIVIDGANDLSRLGDAWPAMPESFSAADREKAERYARIAEVIVWTPGREAGNPLLLDPLPDFAEVAGDPEELQAALDMARTSLEFAVGGGKNADKKRGVLAGALRYFAKLGGGSLSELCGVLRDLPADANLGFERADKLARDIGESILAATEINPLLRGQGTQLEAAKLFASRVPGKVRVSVINLSGLPDQAAQQQFVNQLATTLFVWIKKHPARGRALQGLLVVDEARDFVPSGKSVPGKDGLIRLTAQGRKYGLGMVFATQAPKSVDHNVIANCSTQFYGRANSPAALETVQAQLQQRGGGGNDVAKLEKGQFYVFSEGMSAPLKIATALCLSHHPPNPPDEIEIVRRAAASRSLI